MVPGTGPLQGIGLNWAMQLPPCLLPVPPSLTQIQTCPLLGFQKGPLCSPIHFLNLCGEGGTALLPEVLATQALRTVPSPVSMAEGRMPTQGVMANLHCL